MIFRYLMWLMLLIICTLYLVVKTVKAQKIEYVDPPRVSTFFT